MVCGGGKDSNQDLRQQNAANCKKSEFQAEPVNLYDFVSLEPNQVKMCEIVSLF